MRRFVYAVLIACVGTACGPIVSGVGVMNANVAMSAARTAGAQQYAIYEYTSAAEYLHKSREEMGYSDFAAARIYAEKAIEFAIKARKKAEAQSRAEQPAVLSE